MTTYPKTLRELLAEGQLQLRTREEVERTAECEDAATVAWMESTRKAALAGPRRPGRPSLDENRPKTKVRSLRLTISTWTQIDETAELLGTSANRFIEQAVLDRLAGFDPKIFLGPIGSEWTSIPSRPLSGNFDSQTNIVTFEPPVAA